MYHPYKGEVENMSSSVKVLLDGGGKTWLNLIVNSVDAEFVVKLRDEGKSWAQIAEAHPRVKSTSGKRVRPSTGSIRRAFTAACGCQDDGIS